LASEPYPTLNGRSATVQLGHTTHTTISACLMRVCVNPYPNQITTPIGHRFSSDQTITVLDPRHPLCGQTLPLVAITHHTQLGRCWVVWLRRHVERLITVQATNWAFDPTDINRWC